MIDENLPVALKGLLAGREALTVRDMDWRGVANGALLSAAQTAGFNVLITGDKNVAHQQDMASRRFALVVLSSSKWQTVEAGADRILDALDGLAPGECREVSLSGPRLKRRPPPGRLRPP